MGKLTETSKMEMRGGRETITWDTEQLETCLEGKGLRQLLCEIKQKSNAHLAYAIFCSELLTHFQTWKESFKYAMAITG